ncbi:MAG: P27 family phage terminase small subunit [Bacteroidales bacterium]|nr:P27 family phage terminase small subunit [Bacteroidales bacterium]
MTKKAWITKIKKACKDAGTYKPFFDSVIDTLAGIMEERDQASEAFNKTGGAVIVKHTNKGGATNLEQNPALRLVNDLNRDALAYWRELGLTPAGLKRINEVAMKEENQNALTIALQQLEGDD